MTPIWQHYARTHFCRFYDVTVGSRAAVSKKLKVSTKQSLAVLVGFYIAMSFTTHE
jgi:hypothetical protein